MITIREANQDDMQAGVDLCVELYAHEKNLRPQIPFDPMWADFVIEDIRTDSAVSIVAVADTKVVGVIRGRPYETPVVHRERSILNITEIVVHPDYRTQHVGSQLVEAFVEFAKGQGFSRIELFSHYNNREAALFYLRNHFEEFQTVWLREI